jgi:hypothetical protein
MPTQGYDFFIMDPGVETEKSCRVCSTVCEPRRNVYGPTNVASAIATDFRFHDIFVCPHAGQPWHDRALRLVAAIDDTPSKRIAALMALDLDDILKEHHISIPRPCPLDPVPASPDGAEYTPTQAPKEQS